MRANAITDKALESTNVTIQDYVEASKHEQKHTMFANAVVQGDKNLGIRDYLDKTEMKIKDAQIKRLRTRVKQQKLTEQHLMGKIGAYQENDVLLIKKMENAVCFGKVTLCQEVSDRLYFSSRPGEEVKTELRAWIEDENISTVGSED